MDDTVECRLCGMHFRSIGHHVRWAHGISAREYRDQCGLRRSARLTSPACGAAFSAKLASTIAAGKLDAHFASNGDRAVEASAIGQRRKRAIIDAGGDFAMPARRLPDQELERVVAAVERGLKVATAVRQSSISYSGFHGALARRPDLKERLALARSAGGQRRPPPDHG